MAPALEPLVLVDNNSAPAAGMARVRFVHASPDAPAVDIALKNGPVLLPNIAYKGHAEGEVPAGTYDLEVRVAGTAAVALALPGTKIDAGKIYTVFAEGTVTGPDGNKLQAVWAAVDPSAPPAGKARLRVAHASPNAGPGTIFLNDKVAFFGVAFGQITDYTTVDAGVVNVKVKPALGEVLILDNDGSSSLDLPDYAPVYGAALDELGITYDVWDADLWAGGDPTIPGANWLAQYPTIIYETGDNYQPNGTFTVPTPLTQLDMDRLTEYANNGGVIIAFGQDLASVTDSDRTDGNEAFFYDFTLGADWLQDSVNAEEVFTDTAQLLTGVPGTPFSNTSFDISAMGDGAGNQAYIDEITKIIGRYGCDGPASPELCRVQYRPLLKYAPGGQFVDQGYVAMAHYDPPTLERPGSTFEGAAIYFAFGLEGVNDDTGFNTRADLLGAALDWGWDEAEVSITADVKPIGQVSTFTADMESTYGGAGVTYRWDFGDGTPFTNAYTSATAGHTYDEPGTYTVRVEAVNGLDTRAIGETAVTVEAEFNTPASATFAAAGDTYLHSGEPTTNYGAAAFLHTRVSGSGLDFLRTLLAFDVSSISFRYPVEKALLSVYLDATSGGAVDGELRAYDVTTAWAENTATWKTPWVQARRRLCRTGSGRRVDRQEHGRQVDHDRRDAAGGEVGGRSHEQPRPDAAAAQGEQHHGLSVRELGELGDDEQAQAGSVLHEVGFTVKMGLWDEIVVRPTSPSFVALTTV